MSAAEPLFALPPILRRSNVSNRDSADRSSFPRLGACLRHEAEIAAASTEICHLTPGIA
jgi:hypothetical protein